MSSSLQALIVAWLAYSMTQPISLMKPSNDSFYCFQFGLLPIHSSTNRPAGRETKIRASSIQRGISMIDTASERLSIGWTSRTQSLRLLINWRCWSSIIYQLQTIHSPIKLEQNLVAYNLNLFSSSILSSSLSSVTILTEELQHAPPSINEGTISPVRSFISS